MADYTERFSAELGAMLRRARKTRGMSLADVEKESGGRWKAVTIRNYEMADRAMLVEHFDGLARLLGQDPHRLADEAARAAMVSAATAA